jgi:hypothetical protein
MPILESTPQRLVLQAGSTTLTRDKDAGTGCCSASCCSGN